MVEEYCNTLGIPLVANMDNIYDKLEKLIGVTGCSELEQILDGRYGGKTGSKLYKFMNQDLASSITFFAGYDAGFLRAVFPLILEHKDSFGTEILDVGCNNGVITCFIAKCCPNAHVIGIDTEKASIEIANQLALKLGLTNVTFEQKNFLKMKKNAFDTIFMFKVLHEMQEIEPSKWDQTRKNLLIELRYKFQNTAKRISMNLREGGQLFSVERIPQNIVTYGYALALRDNGIFLQGDLYKKISFLGVDGNEKMPFVIAQKTALPTEPVDQIFTAILDQEEAAFNK